MEDEIVIDEAELRFEEDPVEIKVTKSVNTRSNSGELLERLKRFQRKNRGNRHAVQPRKDLANPSPTGSLGIITSSVSGTFNSSRRSKSKPEEIIA